MVHKFNKRKTVAIHVSNKAGEMYRNMCRYSNIFLSFLPVEPECCFRGNDLLLLGHIQDVPNVDGSGFPSSVGGLSRTEL